MDTNNNYYVEEVYFMQEDTAGNLRWIGTMSGEHVERRHPCLNCPNNPSNGGSGVCYCTLGNTVTY